MTGLFGERNAESANRKKRCFTMGKNRNRKGFIGRGEGVHYQLVTETHNGKTEQVFRRVGPPETAPQSGPLGRKAAAEGGATAAAAEDSVMEPSTENLYFGDDYDYSQHMTPSEGGAFSSSADREIDDDEADDASDDENKERNPVSLPVRLCHICSDSVFGH